MITANELRLGNLVHYKQSDGNIIEHATIWEDIMIICDNHVWYNRHHSAITITPEWLERFDWRGYNIKCINSYFKISDSGCVYYNNDFTGIHINYIHQLQNLYFALTGQELTLKES